MKSLMELWQVLSSELSEEHGVSTIRDYTTVTERVRTEGLSFLTITLPDFGSDFVRGLELGQVDSSLFCGFRRSGGLPAFLSGFLRRVFDSQSGQLLDDPCIDSIRSVIWLTQIFKKVEKKCTPYREHLAEQEYISCEEDLKRLETEWTTVDFREFSRLSSILFGDVFDSLNQEIEHFQLRPKHGPGATADRLKGNQKWTFPEWTDRLENVFPYVEYGLVNHRHVQDVNRVNFLPSGAERPVRVVFVPKTQKRPRVIAIEPTCMQFLQQAILGGLVPKLKQSDSCNSFVGFDDQIPNQEMARKGSLDGSLATLDLSEASDRVSNTVVLELFRPWPGLSEAIQATRSRTAVLPSGRKLRLSKFASMGSATCFPVEAMVFTTLVFMGIQDARNHRLRPRDLVRFRGEVRVFGDDIIVPADCAASVMRVLESFGLKVNTTKSFWTGRFRESCGGDFYSGERVTPLRLKQLTPRSKRNVAELQNWVEFSNSLHSAGYWKTARYVADVVERVLGPLPCVRKNSSALGLKSFTDDLSGTLGWSSTLHRPMIKAYVARGVEPENEIQGLAALHKVLSKSESDHPDWIQTLTGGYLWSDPLFRQHLVRSGRPSSVHVKRKWVLS